ncbi:hypothetical protein JOF41_001571 [Saccharothrix coeruleofusca]|nr:hypothetical protein [Saccharothrix coeruleofusca]
MQGGAPEASGGRVAVLVITRVLHRSARQAARSPGSGTGG